MSVRRDLAAHLAAGLGEAVTVLATSHRAELTPPWVTVDNADADQTAGVWTARLGVVVGVGYSADALAATDALEDLTELVLDLVATFPDVEADSMGAPEVVTADRHPALTQALSVRHMFRICPAEETAP